MKKILIIFILSAITFGLFWIFTEKGQEVEKKVVKTLIPKKPILLKKTKLIEKDHEMIQKPNDEFKSDDQLLRVQALLGIAPANQRDALSLWLDDLIGHLKYLDGERADLLLKKYISASIDGIKERAKLEAKYRDETVQVASRYSPEETEALDIAMNYLEINLEKNITRSFNDELALKKEIFGSLYDDVKSFHSKKELEYKVLQKDEELFIHF